MDGILKLAVFFSFLVLPKIMVHLRINGVLFLMKHTYLLTRSVMSDLHRLFTIFKVSRKNGNSTVTVMTVVF